VQLDPIKPTLKAPGAKRLKLQCNEALSNCAFNFNLRRYTQAYCACGYTRDVFGQPVPMTEGRGFLSSTFLLNLSCIGHPVTQSPNVITQSTNHPMQSPNVSQKNAHVKLKYGRV